MALIRIPVEDRNITDPAQITAFLAAQGIDYERAEASHPVSADSAPAVVLEAYKGKIDALKAQGGYVTADVIDVFPDTPNLDVMLNKFNSEHWHDEDEVRFIIEGHGLFHIHPKSGPVFSIEVEAASARSGCFRIRPAGRRITRRAASTRASSPSASDPLTSRRSISACDATAGRAADRRRAPRYRGHDDAHRVRP